MREKRQTQPQHFPRNDSTRTESEIPKLADPQSSAMHSSHLTSLPLRRQRSHRNKTLPRRRRRSALQHNHRATAIPHLDHLWPQRLLAEPRRRLREQARRRAPLRAASRRRSHLGRVCARRPAHADLSRDADLHGPVVDLVHLQRVRVRVRVGLGLRLGSLLLHLDLLLPLLLSVVVDLLLVVVVLRGRAVLARRRGRRQRQRQ